MQDIINKRGGNGLYSDDISLISLDNNMSIDDFISVYVRYVCVDIPISRSELSVLIGCIKNSRFNKYNPDDGNIIYFGGDIIMDIVIHYKHVTGRILSNKSIDNAIASLTSNGLIIKQNGLRLLNPAYFFKGDINKFADINVKFIAEFVTNNNEDI
jgi:hypothetical protein